MARLAVANERELKPLEGCLVTIHGMAGKYEPDSDQYPGMEPVDINGEKGRVVGWIEDMEKYAVQTFAGLCVYLPESNLTEFEPADPMEKGGFDFVWPSGALSQGIFASMVAESITDKGFCVVQLFQGDEGAVENAMEMTEGLSFGTLHEDVEEDYLGVDADNKVAWLQYEPPNEDGEQMYRGMRAYDIDDLGPDMRLDGLDALTMCDKSMSNVAAMLWPLTPEFEDDKSFSAWGRTNPLVRTTIDASEEQKMRNNKIDVDDNAELNSHLNFSATKKLCIMCLIENEGGELNLVPCDEAYDFNETTIPLTKNKMVIFRCDSQGMTYSYHAKGRNLALQTWVLDTPSAIKDQEESLRIIDGPAEPMGQRNNIMSCHTRYSGCGFEPQAFWSMLFSGGDCQVQVPICRWDIDIYYRKEHTIGFSMTCHGALIQQAEIESFDNQFFGITPEETMTIAPYMRCCLEVGYETLNRAGYKRPDLKDFKCGVFVGDSGSDWDAGPFIYQGNMGKQMFGKERSVCCTRLSHIMGMTGPCSTAETACSSSLVATGVAQMTMRMKLPDQKTCGIASELYHGLVIGTNTLIGPMSYISLSGPGMLTSNGRCFTFDHSADGFARGEGIGAIKLKVCNNSVDAVGRISCLIGACVNQDGRSASMTAPHGPSQQEVIRSSMREGGLSANMITIAECHGTGTALGDPIEVGALRGVMSKDRTVPILKTSAKTNVGHGEAAAGIAGLIKCVLMLNFVVGAPNIHLLVLNPHLDVQGFPVYFETEAMDLSANSGLTGVSSFGFGGTNARADIWGHAVHGHHFSITGTLVKNRQVFV